MNRGRAWSVREPVSLARLVGRSHHGLVAVRATEAVFVGLAALGVTLAVAVLDGGRLAGADTWLAGALSGVLAGTGWALGHRATVLDTARRLDARSGLAGALVTAFEAQRAEAPAPRGPVGERRRALVALLADRVVRAVPPREAMRRALPSSGLPIASPFLAAVLLALALDAVAPAPTAPGLVALTDRLAERLAEARATSLSVLEDGRRAELGPAGRGVPQALSELLADANRLEAAWRAGELDPAGARRAVAELDRALSAIARDVAAGGELGRVLGEAGTLVDAARMQLGAGDAPADGADGTVDRDRESSEDEAGGSRDVALAPAGPDGRMSGPRAGDDGAASRPRGYAEPEAGAGVRTWAAEYDDVVARWVELLREDERP